MIRLKVLLWLAEVTQEQQNIAIDKNTAIGILASAIAVLGFFKEELKQMISSGTKRADKITEALIDRSNTQGATILSVLQQQIEDTAEERHVSAEEKKMLMQVISDGNHSREELVRAIKELSVTQTELSVTRGKTNQILEQLVRDRDEDRKSLFELSSAFLQVEQTLVQYIGETKTMRAKSNDVY